VTQRTDDPRTRPARGGRRPAPRPADRRGASAPDRRLAERRREVVRERVRRRRQQLAWCLALILAALGVSKLVVSPLFGLSAVRVRGTTVLSEDEVLAASGVRVGEPYLSVDPAAIRRRLEAMPWVGHADVRREYPSSLRITVVERTPVASIIAARRYLLVAADGVVLKAATAKPPGVPFVADVPVPAGIDPGARLPADGPLSNAIDALGGLRPELARLVVAVQARSVDDLRFRLRGGMRVLYGLAADQPAKDTAVLLISNKLRREGRKVMLIDVRNPSAPTVVSEQRRAVVDRAMGRR
jgi:cell division protein FtsQ